MKIYINGELKELPGQLRLDQVLQHFSLPTQRIAVEINREVVRRQDWTDTLVNDLDRIEVVHFVGGG